MQLLDAALALVLTMAALATTVTVIMEAWIRLFGLKVNAQVALFGRIFDESVAHHLQDPSARWDFVVRVLGNPLLERPLRRPGPGDWAPFFGVRGVGVYEWVSEEHVLRRLLEMPGVRQTGRDALLRGLGRVSRKYDELCAAATVEFRESRRRWSIFTGVLLAFAINADGVRIFNEYLGRPQLAAAMAARAEALAETARAAEAQWRAGAEAPGARAGLAEVQGRLQSLDASIDRLQRDGLPIGWHYRPHCLLFEADAEGGCRAGQTSGQGPLSLPGSILALLGTGVLIGLGAPFWFDLARRLAEFRGLFSARAGGQTTPPAEVEPRSAASPSRDGLIARVVDEALAD